MVSPESISEVRGRIPIQEATCRYPVERKGNPTGMVERDFSCCIFLETPAGGELEGGSI